MSRLAGLFLLALCLIPPGCGYHTAGHNVQLPPEIHSIAIPVFTNQTQTARIEQVVTASVVHEFIGRTHYRVVTQQDDSTDAILHGTVLGTSSGPLTVGTRTGRVATANVVIVLQVSLTDRHGKVLYQNPNFNYHDEYEMSSDVASFFDERSPALGRISEQLARALVTSILEAY